MTDQECPTEMDQTEVTAHAEFAVRAADIKGLSDADRKNLVRSIEFEIHRAWHIGHSAGMSVSQSIYQRYKS